MTAMHTTVPSENWDDDFEFQQQQTTTATTSTNGSNDRDVQHHRLSMASSDWDRDDDSPVKKPAYVALSEWAEPGPSTPRRHPLASATTENWDDDFEDSPIRPTFPSPPRKEKSGLRRVQVPRTEDWDDEFADARSTGKSAQSTLPQHPLQSRVRTSEPYSSSEDEGGDLVDGGEDEFGYSDKDEEDKTVTAQSRRAALARLDTNRSLPPPIPTLPLVSHNHSPSSPHPFPRSPTASVFSVPRPPSSSGYTVTSTTHLYPTVSRSSSSGLSGLPPHPPMHRERRRLRKKSRPVGPGIHKHKEREQDRDLYEMSEGAGDGDIDMDSRPLTPPSSLPSANGVQATPASSSGSAGGAGTLLSRMGSLKKWGVRRKRGSSTTPADTLGLDINARARPSQEIDFNLTPRPKSQASAMSIPSSSESMRTSAQTKRLSASPVPAPASNVNWFFRSGSGGSATTSHTATSGTSTYPSSISTSGTSSPSQGPRVISSEANLRDRGMSGIAIHTPSRSPRGGGLGDGDSPSPSSTPSKLLKRKSLGFVQIRRGVGGHAGFEDDREREKERKEEKRKMLALAHAQAQAQASQHTKYGGLGIGRVNGSGPGAIPRPSVNADPFPRAASRERGRAAEHDDGEEVEVEKIEEMPKGSVRKLSMSGQQQHQRTKSGVSLTSVAEADLKILAVLAREETNTPRPGSRQRQKMTQCSLVADIPAVPLLPPIELQPPSPPQTVSPATGMSSALASVVASESMPMSSPPRSVLASPAPSSSSPLNPSSSRPTSPGTAISPSRRSLRTPGSPQSASLGRSTIVPSGVVGGPAGVSPDVAEKERAAVPRRSSLGDLKIPERISQAQVGLRRDLGMVREFAVNIERMKELQTAYHDLVVQVQGILDEQMHLHAQQKQQQEQQLPARATSPSFFANLSKPRTRLRSNANCSPVKRDSTPLPSSPTPTPPVAPQIAYKQLASAFYTINSRYRISWECAELLIELGGAGGAEVSVSGPSTSYSAPAMQSVLLSSEPKKGGRERAITLAGDESKPPIPIPIPGPMNASGSGTMTAALGNTTTVMANTSPASWRASTGRQDLSQRQMVLLKEMLSHSDSANALAVAAEEDEDGLASPPAAGVNREWRWGDAMNSTVTLPSEDNSGGERRRQKKKGRLGLLGLRDMLRSLKKSYSEHANTRASRSVLALSLPPPPPSSASVSTTDNSSQDAHIYPHGQLPPSRDGAVQASHGRRRAKTSSGPESVRIGRPTSPYSRSSNKKSSPRRPSLASIFRIGLRHKEKANLSSDLPNELRDGDISSSDLSRPHSAWSTRNESASTGEEEDWDQMVDAVGRGRVGDGSGTVKGIGGAKSKGKAPRFGLEPHLPSSGHILMSKRSVSGSHTYMWRETSRTDSPQPPPPPVPQHNQSRTRLMNLEEPEGNQHKKPSLPRSSSRASRRGGSSLHGSPSSSRPSSRDAKLVGTASLKAIPRSPPPPPPPPPPPSGMEMKLAMTPENIKPLLENAKEVLARLSECIQEIQELLGAHLHSE